MSLHDDLTAIQRTLDDLDRSVGRLEQHIGAGVDIRRVRTDAGHLRDSVALLGEAVAQDTPGRDPDRPEMVTIPDAPYDRTLWTDSDDEGLGARDRRAP
ncbi:hypothetical protein DSC45_16600 [Streptomyces sp. YIM 130001]|uniref:hypothetical protein n=1 Tax=Streptomyces sp. YIM 130001 TaxID=2259644 RepID=UPI000E658774|nr:hypothetical protein [Streptomyces sp. YIM 130001]RII15862.1 hypothetical protein DSC45_16600 [Streptomyces sp. YIM 130001]